MRVMCISEGNDIDPNIPRLQVGSEYTVNDTVSVSRIIGESVRHFTCYFLFEMGCRHAYGVDNFAPLSDIDETVIHSEEPALCTTN